MNQTYNPETYWDKVAENIASRNDLNIIAGDDEPYYRYKRKLFLELMDTIDFSQKDVLEIGSGPGGNLVYLLSKECKSITGVDISNQMVELSRKLIEGQGIQIIKTNGRDLPFEKNSFDITFTSTVLQHNTDENQLKEIVREICRVSGKEVILFERIENKLKGHERNLGRPVRYYADLFNDYGFILKQTKSLQIQVSYYACGLIRKAFNLKSRKEGEPLSKTSIVLEKLILPLTMFLDKFTPSSRDLSLLKFERKN